MKEKFASWSQVPEGDYLTATQLKSLDLPRSPGEPAATVDAYDHRDRRTVLTLYRVSESAPTAATAAQLVAARRRPADPSVPDPRRCADCGARPDRLPSTGEGRPLCPACHRIARIRTVQAQAQARRAAIREEMAALLTDGDSLAVVHVDYTDRGTTPSDTRRTPSAATVTVLDAAGRSLATVCVRLVGIRARSVPEGAEDPHSGAQRLGAALEGRTVLVWGGSTSSPLADGLRSQGAASPFAAAGRVRALREDVMWWRGALTPDGRFIDPIPPGSADRLLYLLREMAA